MLHIDREKAYKLVNSIIFEHDVDKRPYRDIAKDYPSIVKAGTLCRIAKSKGKWLPKDKKILIALGLIERKVMPQWEKIWRHLPTEERHKVIQEYLRWKKINR